MIINGLLSRRRLSGPPRTFIDFTYTFLTRRRDGHGARNARRQAYLFRY